MISVNTVNITGDGERTVVDVLGTEHVVRQLRREFRLRSEPSAELIQKIKGSGFDDLLAKIIARRIGSIGDDTEIDRFINPKEYSTIYGKHLPNFENFKRFFDSPTVRDNGIKVVYDYDVDGIGSAAQIYEFCSRLKIEADFVTPHRLTEGYGLNMRMIDDAIKEHRGGILTLDCGTLNVSELERAREAGLICAVIDHHRLPLSFRLPDWFKDNLFNPYAYGEKHPELLKNGGMGDLVTGGLVHGLIMQYLIDSNDYDESFYNRSLVLAMLTTVADVGKLQGFNRTIVKRGMERAPTTDIAGLKELYKHCKIGDVFTVYHAGFRVGPRINAAGRIEEKLGGAVAFELLTSAQNPRDLAKRLDDLNIERRKIEIDCLGRAMDQILEKKLFLNNGIVVDLTEIPSDASRDKKKFHHLQLGVVGIVASRLVEKFEVPVLVLGKDQKGEIKGSLRSPEWIDGMQLLEECHRRGLLRQFGGHARAGGVTVIDEDHIPALEAAFHQIATEIKKESPPDAALKVDAEMTIDEFLPDLRRSFAILEPHGNGNSPVTIVLRDVMLELPSNHRRSKNFIRLNLKGSDTDELIPVMVHGINDPDALPLGKKLAAAVTIHYATGGDGRSKVELVLVGLKC